ncbi:hypothetical protein EIP86_005645 [Pleurotus ostreatoroseus]|nr:hypothetical protein EIP86_005645 [Pleurotus ostreatoroseus]
MRLRTISPSLPDELLEALEACDIKTDVELLFSMTPMEIYRKISPTSIPLADLIAEVDRVAATAAAPAICTEDILERETTRHDAPSTEYSSGIPELDGLVAGFADPKLIEVSGDKGSCKTLLALQVAVRHLSSCPDHNALWVDTTGDFSIDRVIPILQDCHGLPGVNTAAARLRLGLAFDLDTLYEVLRPLESSHQPEPTRLLIIDNITPLFRPTLSAVSAQGEFMRFWYVATRSEHEKIGPF